MLVILPFWTSFLIRVYAWIGILKPEGLLNQFLMSLGIIDEPLIILNTDTAVYIGIVYSYLPFMILPLYSSAGEDGLHADRGGEDLGCPPWRRSGRSPSRCRCRASSPAACWSSFRPSASSSSPICSAAPTR
jgi:putrescine transport system permease protein